MATDSVKIKMYRHGFGDCFLLQFFEGQKRNFTMLIDCGLKHNDKVAGVPMRAVEKDIRDTLSNGKTNKKPQLDVLVATHEHWDHVSGFHPDAEMFNGFSIGKIWMAWTENPEDKEAALIKRHLHKSVKALKLANEKIKKAKASDPGFYEAHIKGGEMAIAQQKFNKALAAVSEFYGPPGLKTASGIDLKDKYKISLNTAEAMDRLKSLAKGDSGIEYFYPGDLIKLPGKMPGVRIYVLGPPKNALLNKDTPSKGAAKEVYFGLANYEMAGFVNGLLAAGDAAGEYDNDGSPFSEVNAVPVSEARKYDYLKQSYFKKENSWQDISEDWLNMAGALAMQLDSDTNNTSLALAIELPDGKVLLFPGDAQVGNWLSWHDNEWEVVNNGRKEKITASQLLANTVFYKAGHHLSHNATLRKLGLELMKSDALVAFIPEKEDQYNGIPYQPLIDRIRMKTRGRFIFSADSNYPAEEVLKKKPPSLTKEEWNNFKESLEVTPLFVQYTIQV